MIKLSRWSIIAVSLAAIVAFSQNIDKAILLIGRVPLPEWTVLLFQYKIEAVIFFGVAAAALTLDWRIVAHRYKSYRKLWRGGTVRLARVSCFWEEIGVLLCVALLAVAFVRFEINKADGVYTRYGFEDIVQSRCSGDFRAAQARAEALRGNRLWRRYWDTLENIKSRYAYLASMLPLRVKSEGRYKDGLPAELLRSDSYELRVLFGTELDVGARARDGVDPLGESWLESAAPCKGP